MSRKIVFAALAVTVLAAQPAQAGQQPSKVKKIMKTAGRVTRAAALTVVKGVGGGGISAAIFGMGTAAVGAAMGNTQVFHAGIYTTGLGTSMTVPALAAIKYVPPLNKAWREQQAEERLDRWKEIREKKAATPAP